MTPRTPDATPHTRYIKAPTPNVSYGQPTPYPRVEAPTPSVSYGQPPPYQHSIRDSIKKDPNIYPELKNDKHYESWIASVQAFANLHGTTNVLDANYKPDTIWDVQAFEDQQAFMWSVSITKICTPSGKTHLSNHPGNAQKGFQLLHHELHQSLKDEYSADDLGLKLDKSDLSTWTGTYVSFI
jgi:hypothetical protein